MQIVDVAAAVQDLDRVMEADDQLVAQLNAATLKLLEEAGYHADALQPFADPNRSAKQRRFPDVS